jgi:hypothetical protein
MVHFTLSSYTSCFAKCLTADEATSYVNGNKSKLEATWSQTFFERSLIYANAMWHKADVVNENKSVFEQGGYLS